MAGYPGLDRDIETVIDPVIVGSGMSSGDIAVAGDVKGTLPLSPRAAPGFGKILKATFGAEAAPVGVVGIIRIQYSGTSESCKIVADAAAKTINAKVGTLGSEANDGAFGSAGTIDLTGVGFDTIAELVAAIDGYANYAAKLITGNGATTITSVMATTVQAKGKWAVLVLTGTSEAYAHRLIPDLAVGSERPACSVQVDKDVDSIRYSGCSINTLSLSAALKALLTCDAELLGFTEEIGRTPMTALVPSAAKPFIFGGGITSIGGVDYDYVRSASAKANNNLKTDGYGQASLDRSYHAKDLFAFEGDIKLRYDAVSYLERPKVVSKADSPILLVYYGSEGKKIGTSQVAEMLIIEIPYAQLSNFKSEANGAVEDATASWKARKPGGTIYDPPVTVTFISADATAY
jgi:hypothetical protein